MVQKAPIEGQNGNNISNMHPLQVTGSYFKNMLLEVLSQSTSFEQNHLNGILQDGFRDLERWLEKESPNDFETDCINNLRIALEDGVALLQSPKINIDDVYKIEARVEQYCHSLNERIEVAPELITLESISFISNNKYLNEKITQAQSLTPFHYTVDSWNTLQTELNSAINVINLFNATQTQIDIAVTNLQNAINELKLVGNKAALTNLITIVNGLTQAHYTSGSWSALQKELSTAYAVRDNSNITQDQINTVEKSLVNVTNILVSIQELNSIIVQTQGLTQSSYTLSSWSALQTALTNAYTVKNNSNATQAEVNTTITNLQNTINNLIELER